MVTMVIAMSVDFMSLKSSLPATEPATDRCESCQGTPMWATLHGASEFTRLSLAGGRFKCLQSGEFWKPEITGVFLVRTLLVPLLYLLSQEILLKWCERPQVLPRFWIGPSRCRPRTKVFHDIGTLKKISALFGFSDWINQRFFETKSLLEACGVGGTGTGHLKSLVS